MASNGGPCTLLDIRASQWVRSSQRFMQQLKGIHHVTAITGDAQRNLRFYSELLGQRLVKKTVNFDDPGSYHLYYGDRSGTPGTLITFFVWPGAGKGRRGVGEPVSFTYEVPSGALSWWKKRFASANLPVEELGSLFESPTIRITDPDGIQIELAENASPRETEYWRDGNIPKDVAIRSIRGVTLAHRNLTSSASLYTDQLYFHESGEENSHRRFLVGDTPDRSFVDVIAPLTLSRGSMGAGTIHHVAFRTTSDETQGEWLKKIQKLGLNVSPVMDRNYFHSIYFRELSGVLFEVATDGPGMGIDEPTDHLGEKLVLPRMYEGMRTRIEQVLPPLATTLS
jgi:glyoxalase family protein